MTVSRLYFAHPISDYDGAMETAWLERLPTLAGQGWAVVNPNLPEHQSGCKDVGMPYFEALVKRCTAVAFLPFADGAIGAGVAKEIQTLFEQNPGATLFELDRDGVSVFRVLDWPGERRLLDVAQTRERLAELMPSRRRPAPR